VNLRPKARAGAPAEAARDADALLRAVHWSRMDDVLKHAGDLSGKVIISCSLPMNADNMRISASRTPRRVRRNLQGGRELAHRFERLAKQEL